MLPRKDYIRTVRRPYPPLYSSIIRAGAGNPAQYKAVIDRPYVIQNLIKSDEFWWYAKKELDEMGQRACAYWMTPEHRENTKRVFLEREKQLLSSAESDHFLQYCAAYEAYMPAVMLVWSSDPFVADAIRKALFSATDPKEAAELLDWLNIPEQDNFYKQEQYDLVHAKDLAAHVKAYEWLNARYGERDSYTIEQARQNFAVIDRKKFLQERSEGKKKLRRALKRARMLLGKHAPLVDLVQFVVWYRTQRTDIMNRSSYVFVPTLDRMAQGRGITYRQILYATKDEVLGTLPSVVVLNARIKDHAMVTEDGVTRCVSGKESEAIREFFREDFSGIRELKGTTASPGIAKGTVRIILNRDDFGRFRKGDVLATSMTTPQMISIMQKAGAIVTDEGGITCHAAIIARELKKPCIIGTKIATGVFRDGDVVEVDAIKGIVRLLHKAKGVRRVDGASEPNPPMRRRRCGVGGEADDKSF